MDCNNRAFTQLPKSINEEAVPVKSCILAALLNGSRVYFHLVLPMTITDCNGQIDSVKSHMSEKVLCPGLLIKTTWGQISSQFAECLNIQFQ